MSAETRIGTKPAAPLDTTIEVVTPENIAFEYQLAGPFRRGPAFLVDFLIRWAAYVVALVLLALSGIGLGNVAIVFGFAGINIAFFFIDWFYGAFFETFFNGRTPGKWACGIRVVSTTGHPVNGRQAVLRNLVRVADLFPYLSLQIFGEELPPIFLIPTGLVAIGVMLCTRRLQRLGDLAADTMVVIDERQWRLPVVKVDDARVPALATFIPPDFRVSPTLAKALAQYAERRAYLSPGRRREVARNLTVPLIERFEFRSDVDPDLLLYALYWRTFLADQRSEPADLGPLAHYSPLAKDVDKQPPSATAAELAEPQTAGVGAGTPPKSAAVANAAGDPAAAQSPTVVQPPPPSSPGETS